MHTQQSTHFVILLLTFIWALIEWNLPWHVWHFVRSYISIILCMILLAVSFVPLYNPTSWTTPGIPSKINNEIIVQSDKFPTLIVSDLKFCDVPLQVKYTQKYNVWGFPGDGQYKVEVVQP